MAVQDRQSDWIAISLAVTAAVATLILAYLYFELRQERQGLAEDLQALRQDLSTQQRAQAGLRTELTAARQQARQETDRMRMAIRQSAADASKHEQQLERMRAAAEILTRRAEAAELENQSLGQALEASRVSLGEAQLRTTRLRAQLGELGGTVEQLQSELARTRAHRDQLDTEVGAAQNRLQSLRQQLQAARDARLQLLRQLEAVDAEKSREAEKARTAELAKQQLLERLQAADAAIRDQEAAIASSGSTLAELRQQLAATGGESRELAGQIEDLERQRQLEAASFDKLRSDLQQAVQSREVRIEQLRDRLTLIKLGSEILFPSGSAELKPSGQQALQLIADLLNLYPQRLITVEGHTDSVPIGDNLAFTSNWELSVARSAAAVRFLQEQAGVDPARMTVVGYGEFRPVADNASAAGRAANRRIEILLSPPRESFELRRAQADP